MKRELEEKGYVFRSGSDCEILLPLYREYGTDLFAMLDAEFSCLDYPAVVGPPAFGTVKSPLKRS